MSMGMPYAGASAGIVEAPILMTTQIAQYSNGSPIGFDAESLGSTVDLPSIPAVTCANNSPWRKPSMRCACPNDTMIWIAMASSAHHDPRRKFVRTQRIQSNVQAKDMSFGPGNYILSRRGIACVNGAQHPSLK